jgi:hypothetical protein
MKRHALIGAFLVTLLSLGTGSTVSAQATPQATSAAVQGTGTREDPIRRGQSVEIGDWTVEIVGFKQNALDAIMAENPYNDPPADGEQFAMVTMTLTYNGTDIGSLFDLDFKAVGASNVAYTTYENDCGVVPNDPYSVSDVFPGGSVKVNYCWAIKSSDAKSLLVYGTASFDFDAKPIFLKPGKD